MWGFVVILCWDGVGWYVVGGLFDVCLSFFWFFGWWYLVELWGFEILRDENDEEFDVSGIWGR